VVLHIEGTVLREDTDTRPLACFVEFRERCGSRSVDFPGEDLQERETVIDRAMTIMKIARLPDQVAELGAFISPRRPVDLGVGASPGLP
jgi:hypothetical protein